MLHFGELLTLNIGALAAVYLVANWRPIRSSETLRPFVLPLLLMILAWGSTVAKDLFPPEGLTALTVSFREKIGPREGATFLFTLFNTVEHMAIMAAALLLLAACWRLCRRPPERPR